MLTQFKENIIRNNDTTINKKRININIYYIMYYIIILYIFMHIINNNKIKIKS